MKVTETLIILKSKQNSAVQSACSSIIQDPSLKHYAQTSTNIGKGETLNRYSSTKLCSNLCVHFNFLALEMKTKSRKTVNNYGCKLNKQESRAKLPLFETTGFLLVIHGPDLTIKPKRGEKLVTWIIYPGKEKRILEECSYEFALGK